jgi:hypothetical protein
VDEFVGVNLKIGGEDALERGLNNVARTVEQLTRHVARLSAQMGDAMKREAKKGEVAYLSAEQAKRRATEQTVREGNRLMVKLARDEIKTLGDAAKEHEKLEKEKTATAKREAAERLKAEAKAQREAVAAQRQAAREAQQGVRAASRASAVAAKEEAAARRTAINSRREYGRNMLGGAGGGLRDGAGSLASGAAMMTGALGTAGIVTGVQEEMQLRSRLTALAISTREEGKAPIDVEATRRQIQGLAGETGIKATDFAEALNQASEHGTGLAGVKAFQANLPMFSKLAMATDTKIQDIAENSATLTSLGVTDPEEQSRVIRTLATAAKSGNIAMHELGGLVAVGAGSQVAGQYQGTNADKVLQSSALMQMARMTGSTSAEDAATSAKNFYNDIAKKQTDLEALGVKTMVTGKDGKKVRRDAVDQYLDAIDKAKGDPTKLTGILGMQSQAAGAALQEAYKNNGGVTGARGAVNKLMSAAMTEKEVTDDSQKRLGDTATKVSIQLERFKAQVGEKLLPVLDENIGKFTALSGAVIDLVDHIAKGPVQAAAEFLAFKTVIGAASGAVSTWAGKLLQPVPLANVTGNVVNVSGGPGGAGGAAGTAAKPGMGEKLGAAGAGAVIGGTLGAVVADAANTSTAAIEADLDLNEAEKLAKKVKGGTATDAEKARAVRMASTAENERGRSVFGRVFSHATAGYRETFGEGKVTPGNLVSLLPMVAAFRGVIGGTGEEIRLGKLGQTGGKEAEQVSAMMREAFSGEIALKPGTEVSIKDMDKLIKAAEGKGPASTSILDRMK